MKKILIISAVIVLGVVGFFVWKNFSGVNSAEKESPATASGASAEAVAEITSYQYTESYTSSEHGFSFKYPADFNVSLIPNADGSEAILVQNIPKKIGVQILMTPFQGGDIDLTQDTIKNDVPDLKISDAQELLIGADRKGLAFLSDNENFGGTSREVWFVYGGTLYQISTYAELDSFLKGLFGTWKFE